VMSGYRVAKTVYLLAENKPVAVVLPWSARLDLARVQSVLGGAELRIATEDDIAGWFKGCPPGAVPPLRLLTDESILMDRSLACLNKIAFAAGSYTDAVAVRFRDWWRMVQPGVGRFTAGNGKSHNGR